MFTVNCNSLLFILLPKIPQRYNFKMSLLFSENFEIKKKSTSLFVITKITVPVPIALNTINKDTSIGEARL